MVFSKRLSIEWSTWTLREWFSKAFQKLPQEWRLCIGCVTGQLDRLQMVTIQSWGVRTCGGVFGGGCTATFPGKGR